MKLFGQYPRRRRERDEHQIAVGCNQFTEVLFHLRDCLNEKLMAALPPNISWGYPEPLVRRRTGGVMTVLDQAPSSSPQGPRRGRLPPVVLLWLTTSLVLGMTLAMVIASLNAADDWSQALV